MIWLFIVLAALSTFVIAAVTVGGVTADLAAQPKRGLYDLEAAVAFVGDHLPDDVTAELSYDDVRAVLLAHITFLERKGVASYKTAEAAGEDLVLVTDDEPLAFVIGEVEAAGVEVSDERIVEILEAEQLYYLSIGAIGPVVDGPA